MVADNDSLSLDAPWAMGEEGFKHLVELLQSVETRVLLEFGSGVSTTRLALTDPEICVITVDHESRFLDIARQKAAGNGVADRIETVHAPLKWVGRGLARYCTYDLVAIDATLAELKLPKVDAIFIDGPPSWTGGGRVGLLEELKIRGFYGARLVVLDDAGRGLEGFAMKRLKEQAKPELVEVLPVGHGLGVLRLEGSSFPAMRRYGQAYVSARGVLALAKQGVRRVVKGARHP